MALTIPQILPTLHPLATVAPCGIARVFATPAIKDVWRLSVIAVTGRLRKVVEQIASGRAAVPQLGLVLQKPAPVCWVLELLADLFEPG